MIRLVFFGVYKVFFEKFQSKEHDYLNSNNDLINKLLEAKLKI